MRISTCLLAGVAAALAIGPARADITVGAVLSLTGPAAALGVPERNTIELMPTTIAGQHVRYVVLDDASDSTAAVRAARKLIDEEHADIIFGPSTTPNSLAVLDVAAAAETPMISLAGCAGCVEPAGGPRAWAFKMVPNDALIMGVISAHMARTGVKSMADFAFATSFGDAFAAAMDASAQRAGITPLLTVRYNPADASVTPQALRVLAAKPDAVFLAASGTPTVTPVLELRARGFTGPIYSNPGSASADVIRVGGRATEGLMLSVTSFLVAEQLDDANPVKPVALDYVRAYEAKFGPNTRSQPGAGMWDAWLITARAAPEALKAGEPGTPAFRRALRDAIERTHDMVGSQGVFTMSASDHSGSDERALVLARIHDGAWTLVK